MSKLTLSFEPSLIFIGIGAIFGIKVGLSMLLGLVLNYGILAPCLIEEKIIEHAPPKIAAVAAPQLPLAVKAGQTFTVQLEEAVTQPELPSPKQLKADPELASAVAHQRPPLHLDAPTVYRTLGRLDRRPERTDACRTVRPIRCTASSRSARSVDPRRSDADVLSHRGAGGHELGSQAVASGRPAGRHRSRPSG